MAKEREDSWLTEIQMMTGMEPPRLFQALCVSGKQTHCFYC